MLKRLTPNKTPRKKSNYDDDNDDGHDNYGYDYDINRLKNMMRVLCLINQI